MIDLLTPELLKVSNYILSIYITNYLHKIYSTYFHILVIILTLLCIFKATMTEGINDPEGHGRELLKLENLALLSPRIFWSLIHHYGSDFNATYRHLFPAVGDWSWLDVRKRELSEKAMNNLRQQEERARVQATRRQGLKKSESERGGVEEEDKSVSKVSKRSRLETSASPTEQPSSNTTTPTLPTVSYDTLVTRLYSSLSALPVLEEVVQDAVYLEPLCHLLASNASLASTTTSSNNSGSSSSGGVVDLTSSSSSSSLTSSADVRGHGSSSSRSVVALANLVSEQEGALQALVLEFNQTLHRSASPPSRKVSSRAPVETNESHEADDIDEATLEEWVNQAQYHVIHILFNYLCGGSRRLLRALYRAQVTSLSLLCIWRIAPEGLYELLIQRDPYLRHCSVWGHYYNLSEFVRDEKNMHNIDISTSSSSSSSSSAKTSSSSSIQSQRYQKISVEYIRNMCNLAATMLEHPDSLWLKAAGATSYFEGVIEEVAEEVRTEDDYLAYKKGLTTVSADEEVVSKSGVHVVTDYSSPPPTGEYKKRSYAMMVQDEEEGEGEGGAETSFSEATPVSLMKRASLQDAGEGEEEEVNRVEEEGHNSDHEEEEWLYNESAHPFIGLRVRCSMGGTLSVPENSPAHVLFLRDRCVEWWEDGCVVGYLPSTEAEPLALWRVGLDAVDDSPADIIPIIKGGERHSSERGSDKLLLKKNKTDKTSYNNSSTEAVQLPETLYYWKQDDSLTLYLNYQFKLSHIFTNANRREWCRCEDLEYNEVIAAATHFVQAYSVLV